MDFEVIGVNFSSLSLAAGEAIRASFPPGQLDSSFLSDRGEG